MNNNYQWNQGFRSRASLNNNPSAGPGSKSLRQLVQQSRQDHLNLLRQDVNRFLDFAGSLRGSGFRGPLSNSQGVYDVQSVTAEDTTTTSATTSYQIDSNSLLTLQSGNLYTINGVVTGVAGSTVVISMWRGDPNTGLQYFDANNNPVLAFTSPAIELNNGSNTFSLVIDATKLPGNVPQPLSATNPWVLNASSAVAGTDQLPSDPVQVPLPSSALPTKPVFSIDPGSVRSTKSGNILTITGTAREPNSNPAIAKVFAGQTDGHKTQTVTSDAQGTSEAQVGYNVVVLEGGVGTFTVVIDLSKPKANANLPSPTTPYVVTLTDILGGNETAPVLVPQAGVVPEGTAAFSIDAGSVTATKALNTLTITGIAREPGNIPAVARISLATATGLKYNDPNTTEEIPIATGLPTTIVNGSGVFTVTIDTTKGNANKYPQSPTTPYVVTLCDTGGGNEMGVPVLVPIATTGSSSTVPLPTITNPPATGASTTGNTFNIQGTIPPSSVSLMILVWPAAGTTKISTTPSVVVPINPSTASTAFTAVTTLHITGANTFVVSALTLTGQESAVVPVPTITTSSTTVTPTPPPTPVPAPTPTPVPSPGPVAASGSLEAIEGIGPATAAKLSAVGLDTPEQLMEAAGTRSGAARLAKKLGRGFSTKRLHDLAEMVQLATLEGIGPQYSELLRAAGINSIKELARRNPANLHATLLEVNSMHGHRLAGRVPSEKELTTLIAGLPVK